MAERLADWAPEKFVATVLSKHPAPRGPDHVDENGETVVGQLLWERGIRLQGNQMACLLDNCRFIQAAGGIRAGKSFVAAVRIYIDFMWRYSVRGVKDDLWGVLADSYSMAKEEMRHLSRLLAEAGVPHELREPDNNSWTLSFPFCAAQIVTMTASDVAKIASRPYRGIVIAEAAQTIRDAFENAVERVSQTRGWVFLEGTFENKKGPWYALMAEAWSKVGAMGKFYPLPSWENLVVYPGGREDPEILERERTTTPERFAERFGGMPMKGSDLVMRYADERWHVQHRYPNLKESYDPELPVQLWSDPGTSHAYATFAVQMWDNVAWLIDCVYRWGRTAEDIIEECANRPWAANVSSAVMDFAARQRNANGPAVIEQWSNLWPKHTGNRIYIHAEQVPLQAGYDIHKRALLNSWPETEAERTYNQDKQRRVVVDHLGPRLMISPLAAPPLFGGRVDDTDWAGEYNLHKNRRNREGTIVSDDPVPENDDAIKAINYGAYWTFGAAGLKQQWFGIESVPWQISVA